MNQILTVLQNKLLWNFIYILIDIQIHHIIDFRLFLIDIDIFGGFNDLGVHGFEVDVENLVLTDDVYFDLFKIVSFDWFVPLGKTKNIFLCF